MIYKVWCINITNYIWYNIWCNYDITCPYYDLIRPKLKIYEITRSRYSHIMIWYATTIALWPALQKMGTAKTGGIAQIIFSRLKYYLTHAHYPILFEFFYLSKKDSEYILTNISNKFDKCPVYIITGQSYNLSKILVIFFKMA